MIEKTNWPPDAWKEEPTEFDVEADYEELEEQPGFSIGVYWNHPSKLHKPFFVLNIWRMKISIGWLF